MKKFKTLTALFLVGSLALGSCVDDKESKSVENIRTAKAAQLTALAAYSNAQAEALMIKTKAEALVSEATAASTNQTTEESKQKFALKLEELKLETANAILSAEQKAAKLKIEMQQDVDNNISSLYSNFSLKSGELATLNGDLFTEQINIVELEADLAGWEFAKAKNILTAKSTIAAKEATKKTLSALPANNLAAAKDALAANEAALIGINDRFLTAKSVETKLNTARNEKNDVLSKTEINIQINYLNGTYARSLGFDYFIINTNETVKSTSGTNLQVIYNYKANNKLFEAHAIRLQEAVNTQDEVLGKPDGTTEGLYKVLADARKAENTAQTAADLEGATATDREELALAKEETNKAQNKLNEGLKAKQARVDEKTKLLAAQAAFTGTALADYNTAYDAYKASTIAYLDASEALAPVTAERMANTNLSKMLEKLINGDANNNIAGLTDIDDLIAECDVDIAAAKKDIAVAEAISDKDTAVAACKEKMAILKDKISSVTLIVANLKASLDAALTK